MVQAMTNVASRYMVHAMTNVVSPSRFGRGGSVARVQARASRLGSVGCTVSVTLFLKYVAKKKHPVRERETASRARLLK